MAELTLKDLKLVLDDDYLDLNMRNIEKVPVKALRQLPRATNLDFSTNAIAVIPPDFCLLTHITRLDLSSNKIHSLPDNFGNLSNLNHLDLYKNLIEELPLSFCNLSSLKWLDLKNNPLQIDLQKACGDCQDEKGCKAAAINVVRFMRKKSDEQRALLDKQNELNRHIEAATAEKQESAAQKEKASKKKKKKQRENTTNQQSSETTPLLGPKEKKAKQGTEDKPARVAPTTSSRGFCSKLMGCISKLFLFAIIASLIGFGVVSYMVVNNCNATKRWIPSSDPFCRDLNTLLRDYKLSPSFWRNLQKTSGSMQTMYGAKLNASWRNMKKAGFAKTAEEWFHCGYSHVVAFAFLVQKHLSEAYEVARDWYSENMSDFVADVIDNLFIASKMLFAIVSDLVTFALEKGAEVLYSLGSNIAYYVEHRQELVQRLQLWWDNLK